MPLKENNEINKCNRYTKNILQLTQCVLSQFLLKSKISSPIENNKFLDFSFLLARMGKMWANCMRGGREGGKSPFSLLSEPISPSSLLFWANFSLLPKRLRFFFSLLPSFPLYFSLPTFFGPFISPPYSVPPPPPCMTCYVTNFRANPCRQSYIMNCLPASSWNNKNRINKSTYFIQLWNWLRVLFVLRMRQTHRRTW